MSKEGAGWVEVYRDHYKTLQVRHDASQEVLEAAYRRLCKLYHPDLNGRQHAAARMKDINLAYEVLGDIARRSRYHDAWTRAQASSQAAPQASDNTDPASLLLEGYFQDIMDSLWDNAYLKLTAYDHKNVPPEDFRQWQEQVTKLYRMGSYAIKPFRKYYDCAVGNAHYPEVREFSVFVNDINTRTGRVSEDSFEKYTALENGAWRVCLGFTDLKPVILKLKYVEENAGAVDADRVYNEAILNCDSQTGLWSRAGFIEQAEREAVRSRRYGNKFSVAVFEIHPAANAAFGVDYSPMCIAQAAKVVSASVRQTDIVGRWSGTAIVALFTETAEENAARACAKLMEALRGSGELNYGVTCGLAGFDGYSVEDTVLAAASDAQVSTITSGDVTTTNILANPGR